ncbi:MAG: hypothetical protein COW00_09945 [Bdellovibrio sp. CG12_big_fil_rev_8_21_14_0_65_39_13]|nr:MAG: hypothetical protein COW78_15725 [Bdellovibrio sp. CG22_combo_CG10-13_8_21_14_all_39_27]PIQ59554.1 MAG: hypothetical protein COW00_09945 [Bdellovibrio sp. CG12_big_fil_rev_8_21_14_0_65_39_13]PIR33556.1 MAG: hypothetical protein COV37_15965 [Bdellovibrio sp. CG11_big_fil_rev_8_21_14_0_20_39_38]
MKDSLRTSIRYFENNISLGVPLIKDDKCIAYRLHIILNMLGEECFDEIYAWIKNDTKKPLDSHLEKYRISEFEVYLAYLFFVQRIMGQSKRATGFDEITKNIFPLQNKLTGEIIKIGSRDRYPYIKELNQLSGQIHKYLRARLAVFELLEAKYQNGFFKKELLYFEINKFEPQGQGLSHNFLNKIILLNYYSLYYEVNDAIKWNNFQEIKDKYQIKNDINHRDVSTIIIVQEILHRSRLIPKESLRHFQRRIHSIQQTFNLTSKIGRPKQDEEREEFLPVLLDGPLSAPLPLLNSLIDYDKFISILKKKDYMKVFKDLDSILDFDEQISVERIKVVTNFKIL